MTTLDAGKRALITGGTGSSGRTMVRRMLASNIAEMRELSPAEAKHDLSEHTLLVLTGPQRIVAADGVGPYRSIRKKSREGHLLQAQRLEDWVHIATSPLGTELAAGIPHVKTDPKVAELLANGLTRPMPRRPMPRRSYVLKKGLVLV